MTGLRRLSTAVVAIAALASACPVTPARALSATASVDSRLRLDWQVGASRGGKAIIAGYVYNDYVRSAGDVRLLVEAVDACGGTAAGAAEACDGGRLVAGCPSSGGCLGSDPAGLNPDRPLLVRPMK
jgi:hypothetical protein